MVSIIFLVRSFHPFDSDVVAIEHADFDGTERLAAVLGAEIASTFDKYVRLGHPSVFLIDSGSLCHFCSPEKTQLGYCGSIEEIMIGESKVIRFSGCKQNEACTIVLRGANLHILGKLEKQ